MMSKRFDLEEQIMDCWGVCDDLDTTVYAMLEHNISNDAASNIVLGLKELYHIKFQRLFNTFEQYIKERNA